MPTILGLSTACNRPVLYSDTVYKTIDDADNQAAILSQNCEEVHKLFMDAAFIAK